MLLKQNAITPKKRLHFNIPVLQYRQIIKTPIKQEMPEYYNR